MINFRKLFLLTIIPLLCSSKVVQVFSVARHGARTPIWLDYKEHDYNVEKGELTDLGYLQTYNLGLEMRKRYFNGVLFDNEPPIEKIYIKSSYVKRAIESGVSFLNGLYNNS